MGRSIEERVSAYYEERPEEPVDVTEAMARGDDDGWALLLELVRCAPDRDALSFLGAGAMETFMSEENVERHFRAIAREIAGSAKFRHALRSSLDLPDSLDALLDEAPDDEPAKP